MQPRGGMNLPHTGEAVACRYGAGGPSRPPKAWRLPTSSILSAERPGNWPPWQHNDKTKEI